MADALTREHRQIDAGIEAFVAGAGAGNPVGDVSEWAAPLLVAMAAPRHEELVQHCSSMLELLEAHNSKEEPIIYTRADADLPAEARAELQDFLRRGTMPDGWVCERAAG